MRYVGLKSGEDEAEEDEEDEEDDEDELRYVIRGGWVK